MTTSGLRVPQQSRSEKTLERILSSSTDLMTEKSYDEVSVAEIATRSRISVGGFYSRFRNKEALFAALLEQLELETHARINAALAMDWSDTSFKDLLRYVVTNNLELYDKYRGVLAAVYLRARELGSVADDSERNAYNEKVVKGIEAVVLLKKDEITRSNTTDAICTAIACMTAMLREAAIFGDSYLYPPPRNAERIIDCVTDVLFGYLAGEAHD